jgi:hypothetical protein
MEAWIRVPPARAGHVRRNEVQRKADSPAAFPAPQRGQPDDCRYVLRTLATDHQRRHVVDKRQGDPIPASASSTRRAGSKLFPSAPYIEPIQG